MDEERAAPVPRRHVAAAMVLLALAVIVGGAVLVLPRVVDGITAPPGATSRAPARTTPPTPVSPAPTATATGDTGAGSGSGAAAAITERLVSPVSVSRVTSGTPLLTTS